MHVDRCGRCFAAAGPPCATVGPYAPPGRGGKKSGLRHPQNVGTDFTQSTLVISGEHFGGAAPTVRLANAVLAVKSTSANRIVASLPLGIRPATYRLTVTVEDGRQPVTSEVFHAALYASGGR